MEKLLHCAELVGFAQRCSDYGKVYRNKNNICYECYEGTQKVLEFNNSVAKSYPVSYDGKDKAIFSAIKLIKGSKPFGVNFYVKGNDSSSIVYFDFKVDNRRFQVSFHTYSAKIATLRGQGRVTHWRKSVSSRQTCVELLNLLNPNKEVKIDEK